MADAKISELPTLSGALLSESDIIPINDVSEGATGETKTISVTQLSTRFKKQYREIFRGNGSWVAPAGVTSARVIGKWGLFPASVGSQAPASFGVQMTSMTAVSWGPGAGGILASNAVTNRSTPAAIVGSQVWQQIAMGLTHAVGLDRSNVAWGWGTQADGQIGDNTTTPISTPVAIAGNFRRITAGGSHSAALALNGQAYAWGLNSSGQVGDGTTTSRSTPVQVQGGQVFTRLSAGNNHCAAIDLSGSIWCWGAGANGQLGDGAAVSRSSPVQVVAPGVVFREVVCGTASTYAIDSEGNGWAWGSNSGGRLGDGTNSTRVTPVAISGGRKWSQLRSGSSSAYGIDAGGDLYAWGDPSSGRLGDGQTTVAKSSPSLVQGGYKWKYISAASDHVFGMLVNGTFYSFGSNVNGRLGDNTTSSRSSPVAVQGGNVFKYRRESVELLIDVVPGTSYPVNLMFSQIEAAFEYLGDYYIEEVTIEYFA